MTPPLTFHNSTSPVPNTGQTFHITATPGTDIYRTPTHPNDFSAPVLHATFAPESFRRARVSLFAEWKQTYDQGGLCLVLIPKDENADWKWVKAGIEFVHNTPQISVVACDRWADWSLSPLPHAAGGSLTLEFAREVKKEGKLGAALIVYALEGVERRVVRDVTWIFGEAEIENAKELWVGPVAAKPSKEGGDLIVQFSHLLIETE
jgi:uncharacterized protein